jgi:ubiquinone/menaquinone biosynthesis C-methylase UbiE
VSIFRNLNVRRLETVTASDYTDESRARWQRMAEGWERQNDRQWAATEVVSRDLVDRLSPAPGDVVLELAAGIGQTSLLLAERGARVISSDFAPAMVEAAERLAARLGAAGIEHRVVDAQNIELPDAGVDGVLCRWGLMLFGDPVRALAEIRRVLRPGGRFACSVWATADANPWASVAGRTLADAGAMPPPAPGEPGMFALGAPGRLEGLLGEAGFAHIDVGTVDITFAYGDFEEYWALMLELGGAIKQAVDDLSSAEEQSLREEIERRVQPFATEDDGLVFGGRCLNAVGTRVGSG